MSSLSKPRSLSFHRPEPVFDSWCESERCLFSFFFLGSGLMDSSSFLIWILYIFFFFAWSGPSRMIGLGGVC